MDELCQLFRNQKITENHFYEKLFEYDCYRLCKIYQKFEKSFAKRINASISIDLEPIPEVEDYMTNEMYRKMNSFLEEEGDLLFYTFVQNKLGKIPYQSLIVEIMNEYRKIIKLSCDE